MSLFFFFFFIILVNLVSLGNSGLQGMDVLPDELWNNIPIPHLQCCYSFFPDFSSGVDLIHLSPGQCFQSETEIQTDLIPGC